MSTTAQDPRAHGADQRTGLHSGLGTTAGYPPARIYPDVTDTSHASERAARLFESFFTAKSSHDPARTHSHFHPGKTVYFDATLGWGWRTNAELRSVWEQYMPTWPPDAKSYPTKLVGDEHSLIAFMTDTPEIFGGEIRALGVIDLEDGKITRWVDYWDARAFGEPAASQLRVPPADYPLDLGVGSVSDSRRSPTLASVVRALTSALASGHPDAARELFTNDALFEDLTLRAAIRGRAAIGRYLGRAASSLPYGNATVAHIVGGDHGGGYEWRNDQGPVPRGAIAIELDDGQISQLTAVWDGSLLPDDQFASAALHIIENKTVQGRG